MAQHYQSPQDAAAAEMRRLQQQQAQQQDMRSKLANGPITNMPVNTSPRGGGDPEYVYRQAMQVQSGGNQPYQGAPATYEPLPQQYGMNGQPLTHMEIQSGGNQPYPQAPGTYKPTPQSYGITAQPQYNAVVGGGRQTGGYGNFDLGYATQQAQLRNHIQPGQRTLPSPGAAPPAFPRQPGQMGGLQALRDRINQRMPGRMMDPRQMMAQRGQAAGQAMGGSMHPVARAAQGAIGGMQAYGNQPQMGAPQQMQQYRQAMGGAQQAMGGAQQAYGGLLNRITGR